VGGAINLVLSGDSKTSVKFEGKLIPDFSRGFSVGYMNFKRMSIDRSAQIDGTHTGRQLAISRPDGVGSYHSEALTKPIHSAETDWKRADLE
jgi:hypothetical protein